MEHYTRIQLIEECKTRKMRGYSKMNKAELISALSSNLTEISTLNLYESNLSLMESMYSKSLLQYLKSEYKYCKEHERNVYNFIDSYRKMIKHQHNNEYSLNELYTSITNSPKNVHIVWGDCLKSLKLLPSESVGHIVTSPPYYNARDYSTWKDLKTYLSFMKEVINECYRVLDNHRVFVFNVSDVVDNDNMDKYACNGKRKIPLPAYFITLFEECGFTYVDDIIWDKGEVQSSRHKSANKPYPFFQYPCNCYEHILVFHKHRLEKDIKYPCNVCGSLNVKSNSYTSKGLRSWECKNPSCNRSESDRGKRFSLKTITTQNKYQQEANIIPESVITQWRRDIQKLTPVIKINNKKENKLGHTAPFPIDIPTMSTYYYSYKGEIVLDVFAGSFTTAIAANKLGRIGVGFELRKDLFETCIKTHLTQHECEISEHTSYGLD